MSGKLTYWLGQVIKDQANSLVMLVDRSSHRHKKDNKLKNEQIDFRVMRVRADIADLKLNDIPELEEKVCKVAIAKHICGSATGNLSFFTHNFTASTVKKVLKHNYFSDYTLRCMKNLIQSKRKTKAGVVIAFCCHHQCEYSQYVGHKYLEEEGFSRDEFPILCKIASWATCGIKNTDCKKAERELTGRKVKTLLDWGRLQYLKDFGFNGQLLKYTNEDTTLENMCIVATYDGEKDMNTN